MPINFHAAMSRSALAAALLASLQGCATLAEPSIQTIHVQAIQAHGPVANVGCLLSNDAGHWYVNAPGRVTVTRRASPLSINCKKAGDAAGRGVVASRAGAQALWGKLVVSAGVGRIVDVDSGAGHAYPRTITIQLVDDQAAAVVADGMDSVAANPIF